LLLTKYVLVETADGKRDDLTVCTALLQRLATSQKIAKD
jgi:hypothetical protein